MDDEGRPAIEEHADEGGSIRDAVFGEANSLGGGHKSGPQSGRDAQSAGATDTGSGVAAPASGDVGGGDLGEDAPVEDRRGDGAD